MSATVQLPAVCDFMAKHLPDVFDTMLSIKAVLVPKAALPQYEERVTGAVGFGGEKVNGAIYFHLSAPFARRAAAAMLGMTPEEVGDDNAVNDVIGELSNMLTGGLKSWLCDAGNDCAMSTPAIIRGKGFEIEAMPDVARELLVFDCDNERAVVEIHIKLN